MTVAASRSWCWQRIRPQPRLDCGSRQSTRELLRCGWPPRPCAPALRRRQSAQCSSSRATTDIARDAVGAGAAVVDEQRPVGMNRAAAMGRRQAFASRPDEPVGVIVADLPGVHPRDLDAVVHGFHVAGCPVFVPDHQGTGTTFCRPRGGSFPRVRFWAGLRCDARAAPGIAALSTPREPCAGTSTRTRTCRR